MQTVSPRIREAEIAIVDAGETRFILRSLSCSEAHSTDHMGRFCLRQEFTAAYPREYGCQWLLQYFLNFGYKKNKKLAF